MAAEAEGGGCESRRRRAAAADMHVSKANGAAENQIPAGAISQRYQAVGIFVLSFSENYFPFFFNIKIIKN